MRSSGLLLKGSSSKASKSPRLHHKRANRWETCSMLTIGESRSSAAFFVKRAVYPSMKKLQQRGGFHGVEGPPRLPGLCEGRCKLPNHEYFEELAAIAALGELDSSQLRDLNLHLAACARCKQASDEYATLHTARPALGRDMINLIESRRETVKAAFLQQIASASIPPRQNLHKSPAPRLHFKNS